MTQASASDQANNATKKDELSDYNRGYNAGWKNAKWAQIRAMFAIGCILIAFLGLVAAITLPSLYDQRNDHRLKQDKVAACTHATNVTECIQAVGK